jgi:DNA-binding beta-propeller fold protein YncE
VDGSGNVYIADSGDKAIKQWNAATETLNTLVSSGLASPSEVAVDAAGNVYILDTGDDAIEELPRAFIPGGPINEGAAAGSDALAAIVPASVSLTGVFAPSSNASWLTIGSVSGGVVNFSFTQNTDAARSAYITVLGQQIAVTQAGRPVVTAYDRRHDSDDHGHELHRRDAGGLRHDRGKQRRHQLGRYADHGY